MSFSKGDASDERDGKNPTGSVVGGSVSVPRVSTRREDGRGLEPVCDGFEREDISRLDSGDGVSATVSRAFFVFAGECISSAAVAAKTAFARVPESSPGASNGIPPAASERAARASASASAYSACASFTSLSLLSSCSCCAFCCARTAVACHRAALAAASASRSRRSAFFSSSAAARISSFACVYAVLYFACVFSNASIFLS